MVWEERWHPLREEWVIVAAHRQNRPWSGGTVEHAESVEPDYVADCYLCPGNLRVSGHRNAPYTSTFVFDNDMPCASPEAPRDLERPAGIYQNRPAEGLARVVCYSPHHSLTLAELEVSEVEELLTVWQEQYRELGARPEVKHVLIFENKGEAVGVSNPHMTEAREAEIAVRGARVSSARARVLAESDVHAHNSFANPREVEPRDEAVNASGGGTFVYRFAPASVTRLSITLV
jgi:galactose-1-phosphate uridylyltransferase (family 1)